LAISQACDYVAQAARGLQHIHEHDLIHRDVKPSNLLLARPPSGDVVKVLDLGPARLSLGAARPWARSLTPEEGPLLGTPDYLAPEQALDSRQVDIRADIYSLGCTLWFLLTAQPPFPGDTLAQKCLRHQQAPPPDLQALRPEVPAGLTDVMHGLLAKRHEDRYATPAEVAAALAPFLGAPSALPRAPARRARPRPAPGRKGRRWR
jgi:serine/threonine-protein kinase